MGLAFIFGYALTSLRGKGHTAVHETGIHGGPPVKLVGAIVALAFIFGSAVLIAEAVDEDESEQGADHAAALIPETTRGLS